jgi:hypothetical protein
VEWLAAEVARSPSITCTERTENHASGFPQASNGVLDTPIQQRGRAIDEQTAIQVVDGTVDVVSEGNRTRFSPRPARSESV